MIGKRPGLVTLEAEVLDTETRESGTGHAGAPGAEVLHAPGAGAGIVEVDPVVRERLGIRRDQADDEQVAVPQAPGGGDDVVGRQRVEREDELRQRDAGDDPVDREHLRPTVRPVHLDRGDAGLVVEHAVTRWFRRTSTPRSSEIAASLSHIWPGPRRG